MSDDVRRLLAEAAGPEETDTIDVERLVVRARRRRALGGGTAAAGVLVLALTASQLVDGGRAPAPVIVPVVGTLTPGPPEPARPEDGAVLRFAFSGEPGLEGCRYLGPSTLVAGVYPVETTAPSDAYSFAISVDRIRDGLSYDDYLAMAVPPDATYPIVVRDEAPNNMGVKSGQVPYHPGRSKVDWLGGEPLDLGWNAGMMRAIAGTGIETDEAPLVPGEYAVRCYTRTDDYFLVEAWLEGGTIRVVDPDGP